MNNMIIRSGIKVPFTIFPNDIFDKHIGNISPQALIVWMGFFRFCKGDENTAFPKISRDQWSRYFGLSRSWFTKLINELEEKGYLICETPDKVKRFEKEASTYTVTLPTCVDTSDRMGEFSFLARVTGTQKNDEENGDLLHVSSATQTDLRHVSRKIHGSEDENDSGSTITDSEDENSIHVSSTIHGGDSKKTLGNAINANGSEIAKKTLYKDSSIKTVKLHSRTQGSEGVRSDNLAHRLGRIIQSKRNIKISNSKIEKWSASIKKLQEIDGVEFSRIKEVLIWYKDHIGEEYVPVVLSGDSLREKFPNLEAAMERGTRTKKRVMPANAIKADDEFIKNMVAKAYKNAVYMNEGDREKYNGRE